MTRFKSAMKNQIALIIIYNHRYDKNIDILERMYKDRFSNIFHLIPFYDGDKKNVIPVYENSHYFQGYITQGLKGYFDVKFAHYFFIADDLILNPSINEDNYIEIFNLDEKTAFITKLVTLHNRKGFWQRIPDAYNYATQKIGVEATNELPTYTEAIERFEKFNLSIGPLGFNQIYRHKRLTIKVFTSSRERNFYLIYQYNRFISWLKKKSYQLSYPLVGSYSDIAIIPGKDIKKFCHYCGVFAATDLFVELAIPTAIVLTSDNIVLDSHLRMHGKTLWTRKEHQELDKYGKKLSNLMSDFPEDQLYFHPVKLSGWDTTL